MVSLCRLSIWDFKLFCLFFFLLLIDLRLENSFAQQSFWRYAATWIKPVSWCSISTSTVINRVHPPQKTILHVLYSRMLYTQRSQRLWKDSGPTRNQPLSPTAWSGWITMSFTLRLYRWASNRHMYYLHKVYLKVIADSPKTNSFISLTLSSYWC